MSAVSARAKMIRIAVLSAALAGVAVVPVKRAPAPEPVATWTEVDALVKDQKFAEAEKKVDGILRAAEKRKDEAEWTKALIRKVQLETGLHGYETAVRTLKDAPWPPGLLSQTTLDLFYAQCLVQYERAYSWQIGTREKIESSGPIDLKAWTRAQIVGEAEKAYRRAWARRADLGALPVGALGEYVDPNNYPKQVRGTLRDAVSYLFAQLLADSSLWTPAQSNDVYQLNVGTLLAGEGRDADAKLADEATHPLEKFVAVLGDLESWHGVEGQLAAELEARLERSRGLHAAFTDGSVRAVIRTDLEGRLPRFRSIPWWSMGMAELAALLQAEDAPDNLVRARAAAFEGAGGYPQSPGGKRASGIVAAIEAPDYQLAAMSSDAADRRSIEVTHKNLSRLYFRAFHLDLEDRVGTGKDFGLLPSRDVVQELLRSARPGAQWEAPLPETTDFKQHRTFVTPPLTAPGLWIVVASARPDFAEKDNRVTSVPIILGNLVLLSRTEASSVEARVVFADTGRPARGVDVRLYSHGWKAGFHPVVASKKSDADGLVRFAYEPALARRTFFLVARSGGDAALDANAFSLSEPGAPQEATASLVYTDRAIYRPQQKVLWKVVAYRGRADLGRYETTPAAPVTVLLRDRNGEVVESRTATTNSYGSAAGEFLIPSGRALGGWTVECAPTGAAGVQVEEYKRPTFEVKWEEPKAPLRLNRPATLVGSARYYFGLPLTTGTARWRVLRQPEFPRWWEWRHPWRGADSGQMIAQGTSPLGADGTFAASFEAAADERGADAQDLCYSFRAFFDVTDEGGETRSGDRSFRLCRTAIAASVRMDAGFLREGVPGALTVTRTDPDGAPRPGTGTWRLVAIAEPGKTLLPSEEPARPQFDDMITTPGDRLRPRWDRMDAAAAVLHGWPDGPERAQGTLVHDAKGEARLELPALSAGAWRIRYETHDEFGGVRRVDQDFLVAGKRMPVKLPGVIRVERESVAAGQIARVLAFSGLPGQTFFLETFSDGRVVSRRAVTGDGDSLIEMPVGEQDRGGFEVRLSLVSDHQLVTESVRILVPWSDKELRVSFATFRDRIRPGTKETWRVTVKAPSGPPMEAAAAELLAYMYDRSLDAYAGHHPPNPLSLYPDRARGGYPRSSLGEAGGLRVFGSDFGARPSPENLHGDRLKFLDEYGIGGPGTRGGMMAKTMRSEVQVDAVAAMAPVEGGIQGGVMGGIVGNAGVAVPASAPEPGRGPTATAEAPRPIELRSDFSETAFWKPQLLTGADGSAVIEFQVPDSVTSWNVWVHAITRDFKSGSLRRETQSVKDLMVRPYVPRFLREGDAAELKVVVNNASAGAMSGTVALDVLDTETNTSALAAFGLTPEKAGIAFSAAAGGSANATFAIVTPKRVGSYAIKATAVSGDFSDGELRPVPVLPGRMQLSQSRFVALQEGERRTMTFADMARTDDASRIDEQLVVTVDAQLFYSVLNALPYLVNYPYECTEQTMNRFVSTGIVSSLYRDYPAVAKMAEEMSKRDTPLEPWAAPDPTRRMALEETPWLEAAKGGRDAGSGLVKVLDPRIAKAEREASLAKLRNAQTAAGAFPWWSGGPPSPYMTLYILYGMAKASEFGVDVPKDMVVKGWGYLARHFRDEYAKRMAEDKCDWEWLTFLDYVATCYPDASWMGDALTPAERSSILAFSFRHWKQHSPYMKGLLALTLKRSGRAKDAALVWASVMDSANTDRDLGTYWAPEDRSWLWYNDTIETQAFALRTLMELDPTDSRRHGLVQWLFLNKKLNQWKSTRATAEVIYSLVWYLKKEGAPGLREDVTVETGGQKTTFTFEPDRYTGKRNQVVVPGEKVDPRTDSVIAVSRGGKGLAFASATWNFSTEKPPAGDRGDFFTVSRKYFKREASPSGLTLAPLSEGAALAPGDEVEVQLSVRAKHAAEYVHLRDPRAAGLEPGIVVSGYKWDLGISWYEETRDSGTNFFFERLPAGEYTLKYRVRANMAGTFRVGPATVQSMYAPEFSAYSAGATVTVH
jgi:hypothetical protein